MKPFHVVVLLLVAALAGAGGWFFGRSSHPPAEPAAEATGKVYSCSMHPQIRSPKPGRCPICGMDLAPLFSGGTALEGIVMLGSNSINAIRVASAEVTMRPLRRTLRVAGTIDDNDARHRLVSAPIDGRIDRLGVNFIGEEVAAGQPLATFYSPMLLAAEREYVSLFQRKPAAAALDAEHARLVESAAQRLKRFGFTDAQLAALPNKNTDDIHSDILAPVSGTVVSRQVYAGQYVKEGDKLFELADFSTMWFIFDAYERDLAWLKPGQGVEVTTPAAPGRTFTGAIAFIDPNLKEMTRSAKVRVELANPLLATNGVRRRELYHKLYADAVVQLEIPKVLAVPRSAVLAPGPNAVVYLDRGDTSYEQRHVTLGRAGDEDWEVLEGLGAGDRVVTAGNLFIDAQAQLNSGSAGAHHDHGAVSLTRAPSDEQRPGGTVALPPLEEPGQNAAKDFLAFADALTASLASDNLTEFNTLAAKGHSAVSALAAGFAKDSPWRAFIDRIESAGHLAGATDLKTARRVFHPLSEATVAFAKALRQREPGFKTLKIYRCPMTKDAFPGAPRTAEWLQFQPQIRNPYFGAEMLDCGSEVK